jgi:PKD repeat protein
VFGKPGTYKAKLEVRNKDGVAKKTVEITVKDKNDWSSFIYPVVTIECANTANEGYQKYLTLVKHKGFNSIQEFVDNCCLIIAKKLYYTVDEANETNLRNIHYKLTEGGYISYKDGDNPNILIGFDMNYLMNFAKTHPDSVCADEIYGILCHELCHGYQNWPKNCGEYGKSSENFGFVEGTCDLARLLTGGFNPRRYPRPGGSWMDGYNTTGFFYFWINNTLSPNFLKDLNKSAKTINPWSLDAVTRQLFGESAQSLWDKYQAAVPSMAAPKKPESAGVSAEKAAGK